MQTLAYTDSNVNTCLTPAYDPYLSSSETTLLAQCKAGNPLAWDMLIRKYEKLVYKFAYSLCHNHEEAGDISGQVFLRLYQNLRTLRYEAGFTSWLFCIIRNTYRDMCVRPAYRGHVSLDTGPNYGTEQYTSVDLADPSPSPEKMWINHEVSEILADAIMYLPAYQRQVLRMYHIEGKSYDEIVLMTGLCIGTVKSRLNRARLMLRQRLASYEDVLTQE